MGRQKWDFAKMSRSLYADAENQRVVQVQQHPAEASILRRNASPGSSTAAPRPRSAHSPSRGPDRSAVLRDAEAMHTVRTAQEEKLTMALKSCFELYNRWEGGVNRGRMDKMRFQKVLRCAHPVSSRFAR